MRTNLRKGARSEGPDGAGQAAQPERVGRDAEHVRVGRELYDAVTAALNEVIVEAVAAQQAIVRSAHADDVLLRLRRAEDGAHAALADMRRFMTMYESVVHDADGS
jgi:hypothetical protein